jgi:hypothetical protein
MAALDVAGFDPAGGRAPSTFRAKLRKDLANLDPDLRTRLKTFYERNKLPAPATPADQAARYVSLALALGQRPTFDAPERSTICRRDFWKCSISRRLFRSFIVVPELTNRWLDTCALTRPRAIVCVRRPPRWFVAADVSAHQTDHDFNGPS